MELMALASVEVCSPEAGQSDVPGGVDQADLADPEA